MPEYDPLSNRYPSRRNVVYARRAMACTSIPQGAQIGLDVMKHGGNAMDAAVAMAAAMPLLEPTGNGLGSDCFALIWVEKEKKLYGLNASGVSPRALSLETVKERGLEPKLTLSDAAAAISGGLLLRKGAVEVNCALDSLVEMSRNSLDAEIAAVLFG